MIIYKYILYILIIILIIITALVMFKVKLVKQMKVIIFWYMLILILNLLNILGVISFYINNQNRKGPKGYRGIVGSRGVKGESILCESCGLSGSENNSFGTARGIDHPQIKAGRCVMPYLADYQYQNQPMSLSKLEGIMPEVYDLAKSNGLDDNTQWCATSVNPNFEPTAIGFYDPYLDDQIRAEELRSLLQQQYIQSNQGILDVEVVTGISYRDAKRNVSPGYDMLEQDMNEGTGGRFIYLCVKRGLSRPGLTDIKLKVFNVADPAPNPTQTLPYNDGDEEQDVSFKLIDKNLNQDSGLDIPSAERNKLYLYKYISGSDFIRDIKIQKDSLPIPEGYVPLEYLDNEAPDSSSIDYIQPIQPIQLDLATPQENTAGNTATNENNIVDLNRGTHSNPNPKKILLLIKRNVNIINIDTAFVYRDLSLYVFVGDQFFKFGQNVDNNSITVDEGYPIKIAQKWGRTPSMTIDNSEKTSAPDCSKYDGNGPNCNDTLNCNYDVIEKKCEPKSIYDAAFTDPDGITYFFKGQFVYKYDYRTNKISPGFPKLISTVFNGVPSNINAVFVWAKDNNIYFFKGNMYYKYNTRDKKVERGFPKNTGSRWQGMPQIINAIFSLPYFITRENNGEAPPGNNHTYVISSDELFYIDPSSDRVEKIGNMAATLIGLSGLTAANIPTEQSS